VADPVPQAQLNILYQMNDHAGLIDIAFRRDGVIPLKKQLRYLHILLALLCRSVVL
jgi:hypothetical protein